MSSAENDEIRSMCESTDQTSMVKGWIDVARKTVRGKRKSRECRDNGMIVSYHWTQSIEGMITLNCCWDVVVSERIFFGGVCVMALIHVRRNQYH
jgi:hypothetical protein